MKSSENSQKKLLNKILKDWGWLIAFLSINIFNGWLIKVSSASVPIVIYFAVFPLASIIYSRLSKKTWLLVLILVLSRSILAFSLCILPLPDVSQITIILYGINILFFAFLLIDVASTRGIVVAALTGILIILLWMIIGWQAIIRLVLYCNLIVTFNKTGRRLKKYFSSFNAAMLVMTGTAAFGLAVGWMLGSL
ncbi:hypothetical protein [Scytonema sp. PCC 10023]|uniref:hypothetical protein n=1 Tax=Scytonema sp. PCC 10023 TaxID=1680591 RepID=UPI0039C6F6A7